MPILNVPSTHVSSYYDKARFAFTWRLSLFLTISLSIVTISYYLISRPNTIPFMIGAFVGLISLVVLYKTRSYREAATLTTIFGVLAVNSVLFLITDGIHLGSLLWMVVISLFAYFTLGKKWGNFIVFVNALGAARYILFQMDSNIAQLPPFTPQLIITLALEITICLSIIAYLTQQFIKTNEFAEKQYLAAYDEMNQQNSIITNQNKEKELMLKEIHHRVKNNLQVITSLLRLQSYELEEEKSKEFSEAINRVKAMALIHEKMYQTEELSSLQLDSYFESLANELIVTYSLEIPVELSINSEVNQVGSKTIVPLALLFNELISNSIKHAFKDSSKAKISVDAHNRNDGYFVIKYKDNGSWKPQTKVSSFGLELIATMTEQLEGKYDLEKSDTGTEFTFLLKNIEEDSQKEI